MATLPKNPNEESFLNALTHCVDRGYISTEEKETAILADGISSEMLEKIKSGIYNDAVSKLDFGFAFESISRQLINKDDLINF